MRIADLIRTVSADGCVLFDTTGEEAKLSAYFELPPPFALHIVRANSVAELQLSAISEPALVLQQVQQDASGGSPAERTATFELGPANATIVFMPSVHVIVALGIVEEATVAGWSLESLHNTENRIFSTAAVFRKASGGIEHALVRTRSEYRLNAFLLRDLRSELTRIRERLARVEDRAQIERVAHDKGRNEADMLRSKVRQLEDQRSQMVAQCSELQREAGEREKDLKVTHQRMVRARTSTSFRIGRATRLALRATKKRKNPLILPQQWIRSFRQSSALPPGFETSRTENTRPKNVNLADAAERDVERVHMLLGLPPTTGPGPGISGICGPQLSYELALATRYRSLTPNAWRYMLESEQPQYVLVTADGLAPMTSWALAGTPEGRDLRQLLADLIVFCQARGIPIVYWDTDGKCAPPRGCNFDATFTVLGQQSSHAPSDSALELAPAVHAPAYAMFGRQTDSGFPVYIGSVDSRQHAGSTLVALLSSANKSGLVILDPFHGFLGPQSAAVKLPSQLIGSARALPRPPQIATLLQRSRVALCMAAPYAVASWWELRAIASGAHVVSTSPPGDDILGNLCVHVAEDASSGNTLIRELIDRPHLDVAWRNALAHIAKEYSLRDRLNRIATMCGIGPVAPKSTGVGVYATVDSPEAAEQLVAFILEQSSPPPLVLVSAAVDTALFSTLQSALAVHPGVRVSRELVLAKDLVSHLVLWDINTPRIPDATSTIGVWSHCVDAEIFALDHRQIEDDWGYAAALTDSVCAVSSTVVAELASTGPRALLREMQTKGARVYGSLGPARCRVETVGPSPSSEESP